MKKDSGTHKVRRGVLGTIMNLILWIFSLSCIFPIVWMIYSSLKEKRAFNADIIGSSQESDPHQLYQDFKQLRLSSGCFHVEQCPYNGTCPSF